MSSSDVNWNTCTFAGNWTWFTWLLGLHVLSGLLLQSKQYLNERHMDGISQCLWRVAETYSKIVTVKKISLKMVWLQTMQGWEHAALQIWLSQSSLGISINLFQRPVLDPYGLPSPYFSKLAATSLERWHSIILIKYTNHQNKSQKQWNYINPAAKLHSQ